MGFFRRNCVICGKSLKDAGEAVIIIGGKRDGGEAHIDCASKEYGK